MVEFLLYQGKTAVILAVFYMFYRLLLSMDTFHRFNRIVLLGTAALSFILPLCVITIHKVVTLPSVPSAASDAFMPAAELSEPVWPVVLCAVFAVGALSVLAMSAISAIKVAGIIHSWTPCNCPDTFLCFRICHPESYREVFGREFILT